MSHPGDSYVVICGHDRATRIGHASRMLKVAMDMINSASSLMTPTGSKLQIRVGIHSGPAYAGVVGYKCPRYCLFGDSAITADMLQKHGSPMTVHLSSASFQLLDSEHKVKLKKGGESPEEFYTWGLGMK